MNTQSLQLFFAFLFTSEALSQEGSWPSEPYFCITRFEYNEDMNRSIPSSFRLYFGVQSTIGAGLIKTIATDPVSIPTPRVMLSEFEGAPHLILVDSRHGNRFFYLTRREDQVFLLERAYEKISPNGLIGPGSIKRDTAGHFLTLQATDPLLLNHVMAICRGELPR